MPSVEASLVTSEGTIELMEFLALGISIPAKMAFVDDLV